MKPATLPDYLIPRDVLPPDAGHDAVFAWHFSAFSLRLRYGDARLIERGKTLSVEGPVILCERGMHASEDIFDALHYAPSSYLWRVAVWGDVRRDVDKIAGTHRHALWGLDAEEILRGMAFRAADRAVRVHAVTAMRADGLTKLADRLSELPAIVDHASAKVAWHAADEARYAASFKYEARSAAQAAYSATRYADAGPVLAATKWAVNAAYHATQTPVKAFDRECKQQRADFFELLKDVLP